MARKSAAERLEAMRAELAAAEEKAAAKAAADEAKALEKAEAKSVRLEARIDSLTKQIDELTEKRALLALELEGVEAEVVEVILDSPEADFTELTLDEV